MIPISSTWCCTCGRRYDRPPVYCHNQITTPGDRTPRQCPGPLIQFFALAPEPPTLADAELEEAAA